MSGTGKSLIYASEISTEKLAGEDAFKLYDTFGMPLDFMQDAARDQGIEFDLAGFDRGDGRAEVPRSRFLERRGKQTANPAYQSAAEVGL
jgi:alanyl-tRNA synthetase